MTTDVQQLEAARNPAQESLQPKRSGLTAMARDLATMSGSSVLAAVFNTLLVFLIPKIVSVEDFGYWRLFLLYTGYSGFLHMGFADGALLRWAGRPLAEFRGELAPATRFLFLQQISVVLPACVVCGLFLKSPLNAVALGIFAFAFILNLATLFQNALQAARLFVPVAISTVAPIGAFLVFAFLWHFRSTPGFRSLIVLYSFAWAGVAVYMWLLVKPQTGLLTDGSAWSVGKAVISVGWPIVLANCALGLVQAADRLVVSSSRPIYEFAQYSLASSMMFVPVTAAAAIYRVFLSHIAAVEHEGRARVYGHASRFLLLAWSLLLPYFFFLEVFVQRFLPKYLPALPIAKILLLGMVFLAGVQILHMSYAYLYGKQRRFLFTTAAVLAISVSLALLLSKSFQSLLAVALGQVAVLAIWWIINEWQLRHVSGQGWRDWLRMAGLVVWSAAVYGLAIRWTTQPLLRGSIYYLLVAAVLYMGCKDEFRIGLRLLGWTPRSAAR